MAASKSITVFENGNYGIRLEYSKDFVIIHMPYSNKFTKGVFTEMQVKIEEWLEFFQTLGYDGIWCALGPEDMKMQRLVTLLRFKYMGKADNMFVYKFGG